MTDVGDLTSMERVTDLHQLEVPRASAAAGAVEAAETAARAAAVQVREITDLGSLEEVYRLYDAIWRPDPKNPPVTTELLRAFTKAGNYVSGAFDGAQLVGACVGFFGPPAGESLHSHIAGVSRAANGRHVGFALKLHQRAWALQRGASEIAWTFDPLVSRNAYFNLVKLAAEAEEYLLNFYGDVNDGINGTDDTDRLLVRWHLKAPAVIAACSGANTPLDADAELSAGAVVALSRSEQDAPVYGSLAGERLLVGIPPDIEGLRAADSGSAKEWRVAVREVLGPVLADGGQVAGFDKSGWFVLTRRAAAEKGRQ
jgi:predicted GNAT superfamily acetyltransferase